MIKNKKELKFYLLADMMMNRGKFSWTLKDRIKNLFQPDYIMQYLKVMRRLSYYSGLRKPTLYQALMKKYNSFKFHKLGLKLGFSIGHDVFGYGLIIPHYGTIVIGNSNHIGDYAVLHTSTCISNKHLIIGNCLYLSTGVRITSELSLGNNVSIGANSVVNKSFGSNCMIAGAPAKHIKEERAWYKRDGDKFWKRVNQVEELKLKYVY